MANNSFVMKKCDHVFDYTVAIAVEAKQLVAVNAAGALVPGQDATASIGAGVAKADYAVGDQAQVMMGLFGFNNDTASPVTAADLFLVGKVGNDGTGLTISGPGGTGVEIGRIVSIDSQSGKVWVDTMDRG